MWWKHVHARNAGRLKGHRTPWTTINKNTEFCYLYSTNAVKSLRCSSESLKTKIVSWVEKFMRPRVCVVEYCGWMISILGGSRTRGCGTTTKMFTHIHSLILQSYRWYRRHTCLVRWNVWWYLLRGNDIGIMLDIKAPMNNGRGSLHFGWISRMGFFYK